MNTPTKLDLATPNASRSTGRNLQKLQLLVYTVQALKSQKAQLRLKIQLSQLMGHFITYSS